ncbi:hypothetical protein HW555_006974 [Spodoptera exigua]|uniref:Uncharacterized protein n=1 Tax=Spodoptera exigua TaxID=7107 RepID=A0A835L4W0_SPOEX|nr:hypothetical protein HW555_006974 [Spodoptera exigua]
MSIRRVRRDVIKCNLSPWPINPQKCLPHLRNKWPANNKLINLAPSLIFLRTLKLSLVPILSVINRPCVTGPISDPGSLGSVTQLNSMQSVTNRTISQASVDGASLECGRARVGSTSLYTFPLPRTL